jgi:hypothetical protein
LFAPVRIVLAETVRAQDLSQGALPTYRVAAGEARTQAIHCLAITAEISSMLANPNFEVCVEFWLC